MDEDPTNEGASRYHLIRACEASLKRLGTDYIDLYQVHNWDGLTPIEERLEALDHLDSPGNPLLRHHQLHRLANDENPWYSQAAWFSQPITQQIYYPRSLARPNTSPCRWRLT